jgi:hypothetical protein
MVIISGVKSSALMVTEMVWADLTSVAVDSNTIVAKTTKNPFGKLIFKLYFGFCFAENSNLS